MSATMNELMTEWSLTEDDKFKNNETGDVLDRQQFEIEISYRYYDAPEVLAAAKEFLDRI